MKRTFTFELSNMLGTLEKDPDARIRAAIDLIFAKFVELGSVRQVFFWLEQQQIQLPVARGPEETQEIVWQPARYHAVLSVLKKSDLRGSVRVWAQQDRMRS